MRLLHIADVHLDTAFPGRSRDVRARLRAASRESFRAAVDLALARSVDAFLIAGDLFDGDRLSFDTERFLLGELGRLDEAGVTVVYATGNHDPADGAARALSLSWPSNVHVVSGPDPERVEVRDATGRSIGAVTAAGHAGARETRDLSAAFPRPEGPGPEVAVLHSLLRRSRSEERHHPYAPSRLEALIESGYHFWALGHVHQRQIVSRAPMVAYPGNPQGRNFHETGPRGCLVVDLADPAAPAAEFVALGPVRFETLTVDGLEEAGSLDALVRAVSARWRSARADEIEDPVREVEWMLRVELSGPTPLHAELQDEDNRGTLEDELTSELGALAIEVWAHEVHAVRHAEEYRGRDDVLGEALRLRAAIASGEESVRALDPGDLAGFDERGGLGREAYLAELLDGAEAELLSRFLAPDSAS